MKMSMRLRLFNVKYSPNLGDGLLSECLENALIEHGADTDLTYSVDLAGRMNYSPGSKNRGGLLLILASLPPALRSVFLRPLLAIKKHRHWAPHYARHLSDCDGVVIGGGNLFTDMDLNFPTKISAVLRQANSLKLPVAIYGVGVGANWSSAGGRLVAAELARSDLRYVSVRDEASRANFLNLFGGQVRHDVSVVSDPGLMISRYVPYEPSDLSQPKKTVGVCLTSAIAVRYHSTIDLDEVTLLHWYELLLTQLRERGLDVKLFTNGSPEDVVFASRLVRRLGADYRAYLTQPKTPAELAQIVASCATIVGFRMHALIAGASYGRDLVAFDWDPKIQAFMNSIGRDSQVYQVPNTDPAIVASGVAKLCSSPSSETPSIFPDDAFQSVKGLLRAFEA